MDIAPETDGAEAFVKDIEPICPVSIAHTAADYEQACAAIGWGCATSPICTTPRAA